MRKGRFVAGMLATALSSLLLFGEAVVTARAEESASEETEAGDAGEAGNADTAGTAGETGETGETGDADDAGEAGIATLTDLADLKDGDRVVILSNESKRVLSVLPAGKGMTALISRRSGDDITEIFEHTALLTVETAEGGYRFRTAEGYLSARESGDGIEFLEEPTDYSLWEPVDGEFLRSPAASAEGAERFLEFYKTDRCFTTYTKGEKSSPGPFSMSFYRVNGDFDFARDDGSGYRLPVFETSDIHGYIVGTAGEEYEYRLAYIADKVNDVRRADGRYRTETAVLLDGGDIFQGSTLSNLLDGNPLSAAFEYMDYDAVTIGNHEFDWGIEYVIDEDATLLDFTVENRGEVTEGFNDVAVAAEEYVEALEATEATAEASDDAEETTEDAVEAMENAETADTAEDTEDTAGIGKVNNVPVIVSNLYRDGEKVSFAEDYIILDKIARDAAGNEIAVKIGVIGFAENYASSIMYSMFTGAGFEIKEDYDEIGRMAAELKENEGCDAVVVLTHGEAFLMAKALGDADVDLVLGGHMHMSDVGMSRDGLTYLQPAGQGMAYCYAELVFDAGEDGKPVFREVASERPVSVTTDPTPLYDREENIEELDPSVMAASREAGTLLGGVLGEKLGYITEPVVRYDYYPESAERASSGGNWHCSLMARAVGADVGFYNRYGMRDDLLIPAGADRRDVTVADVYTLFPFDNRIYCFELTGEEFLQVLEYSLTGSGSSLLTMMSGADCYFTGETVNALVMDGEVLYADGEWRDGHDKDVIRVAVSEYIATTDRPVGSLHNPLTAWCDTERLVDTSVVDSDGALAVIRAEAEENGGLLTVDTVPHFIQGEYGKEQ